MADEDLEKALYRIPGKLYLNPTTFAAGTHETAFGGTRLGLVKEVELDWGMAHHAVIREDWNEASEIHATGEVAILGITLEQWDEDVISRLSAPKAVTTGSPAGTEGMLRVQGGQANRRIAALDPILFAPLDPKHLAVLFMLPVPLLAEEARTAFSAIEEAVLPLIFVATRPASQKPYYVGLLEHLALT